VFVQKPFSWFAPTLTVLLILFIAYYRGQTMAMLLGVLVGLLQDVIFSTLIGMHMFSLGLLGYMAGSLYRVFLNRSLIMLILVILGFTGVYELMNFGIASLFGWMQVDIITVLSDSIRVMIFNGIFALLLYPLADRYMPAEDDWRMGEDRY
jgi:rod shape-determining protein MreD